MAFRGERYETLRVIASGGMATVHLGRALGAGGFERLVAIKVMHPHLAGEPEFVAMFLDEARLAARIRHPNVVSTLDVQADDDGVFLVMDYVEGPSLQQIFRALTKAQGQIPLDVFFRIFIDALSGLHAAHELRDAADRPLQLVHRDVSPQNILVGADGIGRITDFGVASAEARLSSTHGGQLKGKIGYMSPEQARAEPVDRRTDIYAAGVILWEALAGGRRFRAGNEASVLKVLAEGIVRPLRDVNPSVPAPLEECCMRALARDAADRFATAADFAEATEKAAVASGLGVASTRAVATFVTELHAHERPVDLPAAPPSSRASFPLLVASSRRSLPDTPPVDGEPETVPQKRLSASEPSQPSTSQPSSVSPSHLASEASLPLASLPRSPSRKLFMGLGVAAVLALVAVLWLDKRNAAAPAAAATPSQAAVAPPSVAPSPSLPPSASPSAEARVISAEPPPSAGAVSTVAPSAAPTAAPRPAAPRASTSPDTSKTAAPASTSPVYRPPDL